MSVQSRKSRWLWLVLALTGCFSLNANAMPNPVAKVGLASKTVMQKTYDGAKSVVKGSAHVVKDVGTTAWTATDSLVNHVRRAF